MQLVDYIRDTISEAGFSHTTIARSPTGTKITLYVTRPGIVIGRKGAGIREITATLENKYDVKDPQISIEEIKHPELSPSVMCSRMAGHLKRGTAFRRATMWTLRQIMDGGAMGVQITISGKLRGDRSAFEKHTSGILPRAGHHASVIVNEDIAHVQTPMGLIGVRIRIAHKDRLVPEFELLSKKSSKSAESQSPESTETKPKSTNTDNSTSDVQTESELIQKEAQEMVQNNTARDGT